MKNNLRNNMIFHGAVVVLLGLLAGFPYGLVLLGSLQGEARAWSMAHREGVLNGLLVIAVAGVWRRLALDETKQKILAWSLILMAYGNVVASTIGATFGVRGLAAALPVTNLLVYALFMAAVVGVLVGMCLVAWGARVRVPETAEAATQDSAGPDDGRASRRRRSPRRR